jgi:hypothetical protein
MTQPTPPSFLLDEPAPAAPPHPRDDVNGGRHAGGSARPAPAGSAAGILSGQVDVLAPATARPGRPGGSAHRASADDIPGAVKLDVNRRLHVNGQDLADVAGVPPCETRRFDRGDEPRRLSGLPATLGAIDRGDLAALLRAHPDPRG